jgi:hypothetical protein
VKTTSFFKTTLFHLAPALAISGALLQAQEPCTFTEPAATFTVRYQKGEPALSLDPQAKVWRHASSQTIDKDCHKQVTYDALRTEVRAFWTDEYLYFLFRCPYSELNIFLPANNSGPRNKLWERDVVELFIGADWRNIRQYREFEVAPTGDWIDLAIDLDHKSYDQSWRSGWQTLAKIDRTRKVWRAAARIPLSAITRDVVEPGTRWRMDLYRIDGHGPDANRHVLCWQPLCTPEHPSNHTPEHFGTLLFSK